MGGNDGYIGQKGRKGDYGGQEGKMFNWWIYISDSIIWNYESFLIFVQGLFLSVNFSFFINGFIPGGGQWQKTI